MHRVGQFVSHVRARVGADEELLAHRILPPGAVRLFDAMPVADRRHAMDVVHVLVGGGTEDPDVLTAALLHDVAKGSRMRLWHRVAGVLLQAVAPGVLDRLASEDARSWRHPFWLYLHHGRLSADLAERAGCSPRAVRLMRGIPADADEARQLRALRDADDAS